MLPLYFLVLYPSADQHVGHGVCMHASNYARCVGSIRLQGVKGFTLSMKPQQHERAQEAGMFPDTNTNWQAFFEVQKLILKNAGKVYAPNPHPFGKMGTPVLHGEFDEALNQTKRLC